MDLASLRDRLMRLLPIMIILMAILGIALYSVRNLVPGLQSFNLLSGAVATYESAVGTQVAAQDNSDSLVILERQVERIEEQLHTSSSVFLSREEAEIVLNRLYGYAYSRGVRVVNLQAQQPTDAAASTGAEAYETSTMQLQVVGGVANLIDFIAHFREASLPGVSLENLNVTRTEGDTTLTMNVRIYTSQFASGDVLSQIPSPTPTLEPSAVIPTATPTPTETATPTPTLTPTFTLTPTPTATTLPPTSTPTLEPTVGTEAPTPIPPTLEPIIDCPGAPPSLFRVGDLAVVDFNGLGALRLLADPNGGVMSTRTQAYDNHVLEIVAGPVCVASSYYWYVQNLSNSDTLGWAAEAAGDERYMCPETNPECADLVPGVANP
jgi:hypothetical protein